jgi:lipoprotein-releasing system ATP-binding protein
MNDLVISCENLSKIYQDGNNHVDVLKGVNLVLNQGEMLAIVGSSGSGKSTLLHILGTLDSATSGSAKIKNQEVAKLSRTEQAAFRNKNLGFIYQFHHLLMEFSAVENVAMPLLIKGLSAKAAKAEALDMLEKVGLAHRSSHKPSALSGGERQRVAIARALVTKPALVLADEPTGNLDTKTGKDIIKLFENLWESGNTIIIVTHEEEIALHAKRIIRLRDGVVESDEINENQVKLL